MNDTEFIKMIIDSHVRYNSNPSRYSATSSIGHNCHNYTATMIDWSGGEHPNIDFPTLDPGLNEVINPVSNSYAKNLVHLIILKKTMY